MFFLRGQLYKFTFLIHAMYRRFRSEIHRILEEIISEDSERNRDNSRNRPVLISNSVSGEQPSTSHHDVQSQPIRVSLVFVCTIKYKYKSVTVIQQTTLTYNCYSK
jgi:hypothetical protein